jgi:uncharacterized protein
MRVRTMALPTTSFFLFGPRGTGKTTWLAQTLPNSLRFDLLDAATYGLFSLRPELLIARIRAERPAWVVLDEIQKLPSLLDTVQQSIAENPDTNFALTGSSARKLRRGSANLLAGRAVTREFHPFTAQELGEAYKLSHSLQYGQLPSVYVADNPADYLLAYVGTYLKEEVQAEALGKRTGTDLAPSAICLRCRRPN